MTAHKLQGQYVEEQHLFFNMQRILGWMRIVRGNKDLHPDLLAYEKQLAAQRRNALKRQIKQFIAKVFFKVSP